MTTAPGPERLTALARPSGGFAMVAIDQREALRAMFAEQQAEPVADAQLTRFKLAAARILSPYASGVLVDKQFAFDQVVAEGVLDPQCGLIAAADRFLASNDECVAHTQIDTAVVPKEVAAQGAVAMKLLVVYRPDGNPAGRIAMVEEFIDRCGTAGLLSIIEPVSRAPRDGRVWDWDDGVIAAAQELGSRGADLYKAEVPLRGQGEPDDIRRRCAALTDHIDGPWVVLSTGVPHDVFPAAVELACREGASGFLAGRAVWAPAVRDAARSGDVDRELRGTSVPLLRRLCAVVDSSVQT